MKKILRIALLILILGVAFLTPETALAQGSTEDEVVVGGTYTLKAGETLDGNLFVIGGNATIEEGATLNGDIVVAGGNLSISGLVNGNIFATGGSVSLEETANIQGNLSTLGGSVARAPGAIVSGEISNDLRQPFQFLMPGNTLTPPNPDVQVRVNPVYDAIWSAFWVLMRSFLWAALAVLVVLFAPAAAERVAQAAMNKPVITGSLGLLTIVVVPVALVLLAITICLLPVSLIGAAALILGWAFGIIALGMETGKRLVSWLKLDWALPISTGIGAFVLTLVINGLNALVPCVGWLPALMVGSVGLGAVLLTRLGAQAYPPADPLGVPSPSPLLPPIPPSE